MSERSSRFRPAGSRVGDGEIETSTAEKVLALVLAVFIAIGAIWGYFKLDEVAKTDSTYSYLPDQKLLGPEEFSALENHRQAVGSVQTARRERRAVINRLEFRREAYRTALDAGEPSAELRAEYESAQARLALSLESRWRPRRRSRCRTRPGALQAKAQLTELRSAPQIAKTRIAPTTTGSSSSCAWSC